MNNKINEYSAYGRNGYSNSTYKLQDPDLYIFATKTLVDICSKYIGHAFWCKAEIVPNKGKAGADLHRASFRAKLTSLKSDKSSDKQNVLCKIYNENRTDDAVAIDLNAVYDGHYSMIASVIGDSVYYLPISAVLMYQEEMGNACVSKNGKFINVVADYFIDYSAGSYKMEQADIDRYDRDYKKYVLKQRVSKDNITEKFNFNNTIKSKLK